ncbi:hypothetical protein CO038_00135 [Candidatus Pacearchaeota archaeon CG_4_9_14_0_2_um_filter_39_13]|nr:MAG: hypothetical protein CO038_00135 [Candidatus Pacearchaeota archaeon CG_4_9_14_0_2_um_filter_39_13]
MLSEDYIIGLVDGEGSFYVRLNEDIRRRNKVELKFSVKLRHQDKEILEELQKSFGCGKIYLQKDRRPNHTDCYRFEVNNKKDIAEKVIPFFEKNPPKIQSRKKDFDLFKQIADLSQMTELNMEKINLLKQEMHWGLAVYGKTVRTVGNQ